MITADSGGSNGSQVRLWKTGLQELAGEIGPDIQVCHLLPGTGKWNRIEHKLFSFIRMDWRGEPHRDATTIIRLFAATATKFGLKVHCSLDETNYPKGIMVTDKEIAALDIRRADFHCEWNQTLQVQPQA